MIRTTQRTLMCIAHKRKDAPCICATPQEIREELRTAENISPYEMQRTMEVVVAAEVYIQAKSLGVLDILDPNSVEPKLRVV